jgi:hypothetical protein
MIHFGYDELEGAIVDDFPKENFFLGGGIGLYQPLHSLKFGNPLKWDDTLVKHLGKFLPRTPSIKEIHFCQRCF